MSLAKRDRLHHLRRRVPRRYRGIEPCETVWISLHTDSETFAPSKADRASSQMVEGWKARLAGNGEDAGGTLRALGQREDIIKSMHRALKGNDLNDARGIAQPAVHRDKLRDRITGRVLARDLAGNGDGDRVQPVIDGT